MRQLGVAFSGPSNSGKTTAIVKVANILKNRYSLAIVKHDPSDKAVFDKEGKDSHKFTQTGAEVVVASPTRTTYFSRKTREIEEIISMLEDNFELLIVEGLKTLPLPRISVFRGKIDESYLSVSQAIAVDESVDISRYNLPVHVEVLDLNNPQQLADWIVKNAKVLRSDDE